MTVDVQIACAEEVPSAERLAAWAGAALGDDARGVCLRIVDEREGAALNSRFRQRAGATNVLAFPFESAGSEGAGAPPAVLGDIAICAPVAVREAREQRKAAADHFAHLVVHGVLHLLGMAHDTEADAEAMEAKEVALLRGFGIADPYAAPSAVSSADPAANPSTDPYMNGAHA